jgi:hypothetical protein
VLFLFVGVRKKEEQVGESRLSGVWGEDEDEIKDEGRRGKEEGRTIASGLATEDRV